MTVTPEVYGDRRSARRGEHELDWLHYNSPLDLPSQNTCERWETADLLGMLAKASAPWMGQGWCSNQDMLKAWGLGPDDWFDRGSGYNKDALELCRACPVKTQCLQWALDHNETDGLYGGMTPYQRGRYAKREQRTHCKRGHDLTLPDALTGAPKYTCRACARERGRKIASCPHCDRSMTRNALDWHLRTRHQDDAA